MRLADHGSATPKVETITAVQCLIIALHSNATFNRFEDAPETR